MIKTTLSKLSHRVDIYGRAGNRAMGANKRHSHLKEAVRYDSKTGVFTSGCKDGFHVKGTYDKQGLLIIVVNSRKYAADRLAWYLTKGSWPKRKLVHKNGNIADNRIENLDEIRAVPRKTPSSNQLSGVHYSASDNKWVASVCINNKHHYIGRFINEKSARKASVQFIENLSESIANGADPLTKLQQVKSGKVFRAKQALDAYKKNQAEKVLMSWGAWSYNDGTQKKGINIIAKLMQTSSRKISDSAVIDIVERLFAQGYKGDELFNKSAALVAALRHHQAESCTDEEGLKVNNLLLKTFGRNSPVIRVAVEYYVNGHSISDIALYIEKITNYELTHYQAKNRVRWCLDLLTRKLYNSIEYEKNN